MSSDTGPDAESTTPTDTARTACFEAGIKFGSLYHQFAGTPVSPKSADSLARAIEEAIENQPHCESVTVEILDDELAATIDHGYTEFTGKFVESRWSSSTTANASSRGWRWRTATR